MCVLVGAVCKRVSESALKDVRNYDVQGGLLSSPLRRIGVEGCGRERFWPLKASGGLQQKGERAGGRSGGCCSVPKPALVLIGL